MNIEKQLKEVADYFKQRVISGEFEFIKCTDCTARISIDNYEVDVWIANEPKLHFDFYLSSLSDEILTKHTRFNTQKERLAAWRKVKPFVKEYRDKVLKRDKQKQINKLQKELNELQNK